jgi:prepilin peptidase CpaA
MDSVPTVVPVLLLGAVLTLAVGVSYFDFRERRIPNKLLAAALCFGFAVYGWAAVIVGIDVIGRGLMYALLGVAIGLIVLLPAYALRQVGAGDVKLMMVFGFLLGPIGAAITLLTGALIGGIWALFLSWRSAGLAHTFGNMKMMARSAYLSGLRTVQFDLRSAGAVRMPYGVALSASAALVALWQLSLR